MSDHPPFKKRKTFCYRSLPDDIFGEIFVRLPVKSILRCAAVCKSWNALLKTPAFISLHLNRQAAAAAESGNRRLLLFRALVFDFSSDDDDDSSGYDSYSPYLLSDSDSGDDGLEMNFRMRETYSLRREKQPPVIAEEPFDECTELDFPFSELHECGAHYGGFIVVGSLDGLICLADFQDPPHDHIIIWNPHIRRSVTLPTHNSGLQYASESISMGFGYDSAAKDYKLVSFGILEEDMPTHKLNVEVYSLNAGTWTSTPARPPDCSTWRRETCTFVNGCLHLAVFHPDHGEFILLFDLSTQEFGRASLPRLALSGGHSLWEKNGPSVSLSSFEDTLAVYSRHVTGSDLHVWVMKSYRVQDSWTKLFTIDFRSLDTRRPCRKSKYDRGGIILAFLKNGGVILDMGRTYDGILSYFHPESEEFSNLSFHGKFTFCAYHVESLVLLNRPNDKDEQDQVRTSRCYK